MDTKRKILKSIIFMILLITQFAAPPRKAFAAGTVGTGTPASCDEAALNAALVGGGLVDFNCGASPHTITITGTKTISANTQIDGGGLITISGGNAVRLFLVNAGISLDLTGLTLSNGFLSSGTGGAAIYMFGGATVNITNSTITNNTSTTVSTGGGAIYNQGTLNITGSTFFLNATTAAGTDGGAVLSDGFGTSTIISNSTFYNNTAGNLASVPPYFNSTGGAVNIRNSGGTNTIVHVTISNNTNESPYGALDIVNTNSTVSHSIIANSTTGVDCSNRGTGTITSSNNLIESDSACGAAVTTDPGLGALQDNGGPTQTMAITAASPAYNFTATCPLAVDQRGVARPQPVGGNCDLGAFELGDSVAPSLISFTRQNPATSPTNADTLVFRATFSEDVQNVDSTDFSVNSTSTATITNVTPVNAFTYDITVSGGDLANFNGTVGIDLSGGQNIQDLAGNALPAGEPATDEIYVVDNSGPTVTIDQAAGQADPTSTSPINFTVVFSESVTGFTNTDVTLGGTAGATTVVVTGSGTTYNVAVSGMTGDGTVTATVNAGAVTDGLGNPSAASTSTDNTVTYDTTGPTVTIDQAAAQADPTSTSPINFTVVFSEPVTGFATGDVTLSGTAGATTATVTEIAPNDGTTYNVAVSGMTGDGTVIATIAAGVAVDGTGNGNSASTSTDNTVTYDTSGPTVTINQAAAQADPTNTSPINFTVVFSEPVTGFATGDVTLGGTAGATTATVTEIAPNDGTTYNVAVSGMTTSGTVIASIGAGVAVDGSGNNNLASSSTDNTVIYDLGYPTVLSSVPTNNATVSPGPTQLTVRYSEDVKNDGSAGAANNTANYLLVRDGVNGAFDTLSCLGGLLADDVLVTINSASYTNNGGGGPFVATININNGTALPIGTYRLYVCGTTSIEDLADNELNNGLADTTIDFTVVQRQNTPQPTLLPATGFPQNTVTTLQPQPTEKAYATTGLWLEIPTLGVKMSIVGVPQSDNQWDITWLDKNAGWLNGSAFPTWTGNSVLTGHVWDAFNKPGPFALLKNLQFGDQIRIHAFGQIFIYEIRENKNILPTSIPTVFKHEEKSWITLITCENYVELTQQYTRRRMVRAVLVQVTEE